MNTDSSDAPTTPEEFGAFIRNEVAQNIKVVKAAGIKVEQFRREA